MTVLQSALRPTVFSCGYYSSLLVNRFFSSSPVWNFSPKISLEEKLGIPPRPKRPQSPFLKFLSQKRESTSQLNPQASPQEIVKIISEQWKKADTSLKNVLEEEYKKERDKYFDEIESYKKLLSPIDKEEIARAKEETKTAKEKRALKKKKEELGCPKKPLSSYLSFFQSKIPERRALPMQEFIQNVKKEWATLPGDEKNKYEQQFKKDMEVYRTKMDQWLARMRAEGHEFAKSVPKMAKPKDLPKKPGAAFSFYQKARFADYDGKDEQEFQKKLHEEWKQLASEDKKKYEEMRRKALDEYKLKMEKWSKSTETKPNPGEILYPRECETSSINDASQNEVIHVKDLTEKPQASSSEVTLPLTNHESKSLSSKTNSFFRGNMVIYASVLISVSLVCISLVYLFVFY